MLPRAFVIISVSGAVLIASSLLAIAPMLPKLINMYITAAIIIPYIVLFLTFFSGFLSSPAVTLELSQSFVFFQPVLHLLYLVSLQPTKFHL